MKLCPHPTWVETASHDGTSGLPVVRCTACGKYAEDPRAKAFAELWGMFRCDLRPATALGAARRAMQDEVFATELQHIAAWIHAIETAIAPAADRDSAR